MTGKITRVLAAVALALPSLQVFASDQDLLSTGVTGTVSASGKANPGFVMRPIQVQRLLLEVAHAPQDRERAARALEGSGITVDDLLVLRLLRTDHGRLMINFNLLTQEDQAEILQAVSTHATTLAEGFLARRGPIDALLAERTLRDVPAADFAYILVGCFSLDWDGLRYTNDPRFRSGPTHRSGGDAYTPWAKERGNLVSLRALYWGSHNTTKDGINLTTFGDHHALPRVGFPDLTWLLDADTESVPEDGGMRASMTAVAYRFLDQIHGAVGRTMESLGSGPKSAEELAEATHLDPETLADLLDLLQKVGYVAQDGSRYRAMIPVLTEADTPMVRGVLALGREVIRQWHEEHYDELAADLGDLTPVRSGVPYEVVYTEVWHYLFGLTNRKLVEAGMLADPYASSREHKGFVPVVWLPGQQRLQDGDGPDRQEATPS
jgi:hypothetical protein